MVKLRKGEKKVYQIISLCDGTFDQGWCTPARDRRHALMLYKKHRMDIENSVKHDARLKKVYDRLAKHDLVVNVWACDEYGDNGRIIGGDEVIVVPCKM